MERGRSDLDPRSRAVFLSFTVIVSGTKPTSNRYMTRISVPQLSASRPVIIVIIIIVFLQFLLVRTI